MERVWGPIGGFYLAAYATAAGEDGLYCSYAKVCWTRPSSYWDADCVFKVYGGAKHRSAESALRWVALCARNQIDRLPAQAKRLAEACWRTRLRIPRLFVTALFKPRPIGARRGLQALPS